MVHAPAEEVAQAAGWQRRGLHGPRAIGVGRDAGRRPSFSRHAYRDRNQPGGFHEATARHGRGTIFAEIDGAAGARVGGLVPRRPEARHVTPRPRGGHPRRVRRARAPEQAGPVADGVRLPVVGRPAMSAARRNGGSRPCWRTRNARWPPSWSRPASTECCPIGRSEQRHDSGGPPGAARRFPLQSLRQLFFERKPIMETANTIAAINETTGLAPAAGGVAMLETALIDQNPANPRRDVAMWASWPIPSAPKASDRTCWSCPRRRDGSRWSSAIGGWRPRNWRDWNGFRRSWPSWTNGNSAS